MCLGVHHTERALTHPSLGSAPSSRLRSGSGGWIPAAMKVSRRLESTLRCLGCSGCSGLREDQQDRHGPMIPLPPSLVFLPTVPSPLGETWTQSVITQEPRHHGHLPLITFMPVLLYRPWHHHHHQCSGPESRHSLMRRSPSRKSSERRWRGTTRPPPSTLTSRRSGKRITG